jgi:hypothetical protein
MPAPQITTSPDIGAMSIASIPQPLGSTLREPL